MTDCDSWGIEVREPAEPLRPVRIEWQMEHQFWSVMLRSIVRVASWMVGEMNKEGLVAGAVIIVGW